MKIRFQTLQEKLRSSIWARLERGDMTGKGLAKQAGFQQAHLSNFLNARRGLSLQAMDRLLDVLHLDVLDLAGVNEADRHSQNTGEPKDTQIVPVVPLKAAAHSVRFSADDIQDVIGFERSFLRRLKPKMVGNRRDWTRFAVIEADEENADCMAPLLKPGALLLIDRHHNAPPPQSSPWDPALYLTTDGATCFIRRVTVAPGNLVLRPVAEGPNSGLRLIAIPSGRRHSDFVVGRVCHLAMQL